MRNPSGGYEQISVATCVGSQQPLLIKSKTQTGDLLEHEGHQKTFQLRSKNN